MAPEACEYKVNVGGRSEYREAEKNVENPDW